MLGSNPSATAGCHANARKGHKSLLPAEAAGSRSFCETNPLSNGRPSIHAEPEPPRFIEKNPLQSDK